MLGALLRALRGDRSAEDAAKAVGVTRSTIYLWESTQEANKRTGKPKHRRLPELHNLVALLEHYGATEPQKAEALSLLAQEQRAARAESSLENCATDPL